MVALGDRTVLAPAVVARRTDGALVTGESALRRATTEPHRVARAVRRRLGDPTPVLLGDESVGPTDLLAALLRGAVDRATGVQGDRPRRVVLTHPASWGPYRRGLLDDVAAAAGLADVVTVCDPEAAVGRVAAVRGLPDGAPHAVLDLGGTSCEAAVVDGGTLVGVPVAVERLGGDDLDEAVAAVADEASGGLLAELDPEDPASVPALTRFRADCVAAKEALSVDHEAVVGLLLPGRHVDVTVRRAAFEARIAPVVERAVAALRQALDAAEVRADDLGAVLLVGGSARVPLVVRAVRTAVAAPVVVEPHPDHVVALGAVRLGAARGVAASAAGGETGGDDGGEGRTSLTPLRPPIEDGRTTAVRVPPAAGARGAGPRGPAARGGGPRPGPGGPRASGPGPGRFPPTGPFPPAGAVPGTGPFPGPFSGSGPFPPSGPFRAAGPPPGRPARPGAPVGPPGPGGRPTGPPPPSAPGSSAPESSAPGSGGRSGRGRTVLLVLVVVLVVAALVVGGVLLLGG
nr:Hsp70 family protein [Actinomycetospora corticicola]